MTELTKEEMANINGGRYLYILHTLSNGSVIIERKSIK
jgi:lactobin A/cerein 7B family class IIb bacteriocin